MFFLSLVSLFVFSACSAAVITGGKVLPETGSFFRISGQVSPLFVRSTSPSASMFGTLGSSNNRLRFWHQSWLSTDLAVRGTFELGFDLHSTVNSSPQWPVPNTIDYRKIYISLYSKTYGELSFGKNKTATDDTAEQDLCFSILSIAPLTYGLTLKQEGTADGHLRLSGVLHNFDGSARATCLRYDSPMFKGLGLRVDLHNDSDPNNNGTNEIIPGVAVFGRWSFADGSGKIRFASGLTKQLGAIGIKEIGLINTNSYSWSNSASIMMPSGCGASATYSLLTYQHHPFKNAPYYWLAKFFHTIKTLPNPVSFGFDFSRCNNLHAFALYPTLYGAAQSWGFFIAQSYPKMGIEAFFVFKRISYNLDQKFQGAPKFLPANVIMVGMRVVF